MFFAVRVFDPSEGEGYAPSPRLYETREELDNDIKGGDWDVWETPTPLVDAKSPEAAQYIGRLTGKADVLTRVPPDFEEASSVVRA